MHHHGWYEGKFLRLENFLQRQKLFVLIDYNLIVIDYNKLSEACRVKFRISLIDYRYLVIDYTVIWDNDWFFKSLCFTQLPSGLIDYLSLIQVFKVEQEHFNQLLRSSNRLHYSWVVFQMLGEHFNRFT